MTSCSQLKEVKDNKGGRVFGVVIPVEVRLSSQRT